MMGAKPWPVTDFDRRFNTSVFQSAHKASAGPTASVDTG